MDPAAHGPLAKGATKTRQPWRGIGESGIVSPPMNHFALTNSLIEARFPQAVDQPDPGSEELTDAQLANSLDAMLTGLRGDTVWLFAYGALLWDPDAEAREWHLARVYGYHRRFCMWQFGYRGTKEQPNLMMALEPGGACNGIVQRIDGPHLRDHLWPIWDREMRGDGYVPRWTVAHTVQGRRPAIAFVMKRANSVRYAGRLDEVAVARYIAAACGPDGPGAQYLCRTVEALGRLGLRDSMLWRVQGLVATNIRQALNG